MKKLLFLILLVPCLVKAESADSIKYVGACATPGVCWGIVVKDTFAYIADRGSITVVNVKEPNSPYVVSSFSDNPYSLALGICVKDSVIYPNAVSLVNCFSIISVANPESLSVIGWTRMPLIGFLDARGVVVADTIAYLAIGDKGIIMVNVSDPTSPDTIQSYETKGCAVDIVVKDLYDKNIKPQGR